MKRESFQLEFSTENYHDHIELLYTEEEQTAKDQTVKNHYVYIKDFNRIMYHFTKHKERKHFVCIVNQILV